LVQYSFQQALKHKIIQKHCHIEFKNKKRKIQYIQIQKLTPLLIGQSKIIYLEEMKSLLLDLLLGTNAIIEIIQN
jgi:hypothetical protein